MSDKKKDVLRKDLLIFLKIVETGDYTILGSGGEEIEPYNLGWVEGDVTIANDDVRVKLDSKLIDDLGGIIHLTDNSKIFQDALLGNGRKRYALNSIIERAIDEYTKKEIKLVNLGESQPCDVMYYDDDDVVKVMNLPSLQLKRCTGDNLVSVDVKHTRAVRVSDGTESHLGADFVLAQDYTLKPGYNELKIDLTSESLLFNRLMNSHEPAAELTSNLDSIISATISYMFGYWVISIGASIKDRDKVISKGTPLIHFYTQGKFEFVEDNNNGVGDNV